MTTTVLKVIVPNIKGLHARAAAQIVFLSSEYPCKIKIAHKQKQVSSLSLINLLTLDAPQGSELIITSSGENSKLAARAIETLILSGFGEQG